MLAASSNVLGSASLAWIALLGAIAWHCRHISDRRERVKIEGYARSALNILIMTGGLGALLVAYPECFSAAPTQACAPPQRWQDLFSIVVASGIVYNILDTLVDHREGLLTGYFLAHHAVTTAAIAVVGYYQRGASLMPAFFWMELTSLTFVIGGVIRTRAFSTYAPRTTHLLRAHVEPWIFQPFYIVVRMGVILCMWWVWQTDPLLQDRGEPCVQVLIAVCVGISLFNLVSVCKRVC